MKTATWPLQEARNRFSEVVERARTQREQTITKHGKPVVVMMSVEDFKKMERRKPRAKTGAGLVSLLRRCPAAEVFDWIEKSRSRETARDLDLG